MTKTIATVSLLLAALGAAAAPVAAGDMNHGMRGSSKDAGMHGTPVPAPMPYEEHYKYYVGAGLGWTIAASGDIGLTVGGTVIGSAPTFGGADEFRGPFVVSLVAGRYITPSLRMELGIDFRHEQRRARTSAYTATLSSTEPIGPGGAPVAVTNTYSMARMDSVEIRNNTMMLNAYYDFNRGGRLKPYLGAGIGVVQMQLHRSAFEVATDCSSTDPTSLTPAAPVTCWTGTSPTEMPGAVALANAQSQTGYGLAASLMAGVSYNLSPRTHLDVGYRLMYQGGKAVVSGESLGYCGTTCLTGISTLRVDARLDHEIRTGLRWDLW